MSRSGCCSSSIGGSGRGGSRGRLDVSSRSTEIIIPLLQRLGIGGRASSTDTSGRRAQLGEKGGLAEARDVGRLVRHWSRWRYTGTLSLLKGLASESTGGEGVGGGGRKQSDTLCSGRRGKEGWDEDAEQGDGVDPQQGGEPRSHDVVAKGARGGYRWESGTDRRERRRGRERI